jgi:hypothetical protein
MIQWFKSGKFPINRLIKTYQVFFFTPESKRFTIVKLTYDLGRRLQDCFERHGIWRNRQTGIALVKWPQVRRLLAFIALYSYEECARPRYELLDEILVTCFNSHVVVYSGRNQDN